MMLAQAYARGDEAEAKRLHDTTPIKSYRCPQLEFDFPFKVMWQLVYVLSIRLNESIGRLRTIEKMQRLTVPLMELATFETVPKLLDLLGEEAEQQTAQAILDARNSGPDDNHRVNDAAFFKRFTSEAQKTVGRMLADQYSDVASEAAALVQSFDNFTRKVLDLDGLTVLRAWMEPIADAVEALRILEHEPDSATLAEWSSFRGRFWNRMMEFQGLAQSSSDGRQYA